MNDLNRDSGDFETLSDTGANFIGREDDLAVLAENWTAHRIIGIFGIRSVGKSRLCDELVTRQRRPWDDVFKFDARWLPDMTSLYTNLCVRLGLQPKSESVQNGVWIKFIVGVIRSNENRRFILVFDNTEDYQEAEASVRDSFLSLCTTLVRHCNNVKIIITSTMRVQLAQLRRTYFCYELLPFKNSESLALLRSELYGCDVDLGECSDSLVRLCEGLPLLLLMVSSELREDAGMLTPRDMVELLATCRLKALSREFYPEEDRVADVYRKFTERLASVYRRRLAVLEYIPGSFTAAQAQKMLDMPTEAQTKDQALIPVRRRHYLTYDAANRRYDIQGILRDCLNTFHAIKNIPVVRERYARTFSEVMVGLSERLGTEQYTRALAEFSLEQPNLHKLLTEVRHTRQDTYKFFIKMATESTELIEKYMAGDGEMFYDGCLQAARTYGQTRDIAVVNLAVGSLYTNTKGNLVSGEQRYQGALSALEVGDKSLLMATLHQRLGWNFLMQGRCLEAVDQFSRSLNISLVSGKPFEMQALSSLSSMGVSLTVLGHFEEAERYHFTTLRRRKLLQGELHPAVGATLNNIGLMFDQKGDSEAGLRYFLEGLEIKKKSKASDLSLLMSLNNVASVYNSLGRTKEAHEVLDEVEVVVNRQKVPPGDPVGYMFNSRSVAFLKEGNLTKARQMAEISVAKRKSVSANSPAYVESLVNLINIAKRQKDFDMCVKKSDEVLKLQSAITKQMPQNSFIGAFLEDMVEVYDELGDKDMYRITLGQLESELVRLDMFFSERGNERKSDTIRAKLVEVHSKLQSEE